MENVEIACQLMNPVSDALSGMASVPQGIGAAIAIALPGERAFGWADLPLADLVGGTELTGIAFLFGMTELAAISSQSVTDQPRKAPSSHRQRELHFRETRQDLLVPFAGQWVCLERETIVSHGSNVTRVAEEARRKGVQMPYVFRVSDEPQGSVPIGL
jgi:hypothetical protein